MTREESYINERLDHLGYVGFARSWERMVLRGSYDSRKFLAFYLTQGILQAACGLSGRIRLSETALADDRVDLQSLNIAAP